MTTSDRQCKDCLDSLLAGEITKMPKRPALNPGPRCTTHWRAEVRRRKADAAERRNQNVYGLVKGEYARLYEFQGGRCAICRRATGKSKRLAVDHDHKTGEVRGLCCSICNRVILGHSRDDVRFFLRCLAYLRRPPYKRMKEGGEFFE
jgi:hypothetical protein